MERTCQMSPSAARVSPSPDIADQRQHTWLGGSVILTLAVLVVLGLVEFDRVFYEQVSLVLNTAHPLDRDFYAVTRPLWFVVRTVFAHLAGAAVACGLVVVLHRERWRAAGRLLVTVGVAVVAAIVLEVLIGRSRPNQGDTYLTFVPLGAITRFRVENSCFPSGEATMACALAFGLAQLFPPLRGLFYAMAALASIARLVNGAHYLSDVSAGALLGLLCGRVVYAYLSTSGPRALRASRSP